MKRALLLSAVLCACSGAQTSTDTAATVPPLGPGAIAITNVRVFDGTKVTPRATVVLDGERIAALTTAADPELPAGITTIDGANKTLLPGLIDAHTHTWDAGQLEQAAVLGVTTELDMMGMPGAAAALKEASATAPVADLRAAGYAVTVEGGHGTQYGFEVPTLARAEDAAAFVAARVAEGSDYIKLIRDDFHQYDAERPTLDDAMMKAAIAAAHEHDKLAVVHVGTAADARAAVLAGADGLVHGYFGAHPDVAKLIAERGVFVVPTLSVLHSICSGSARSESLLADEQLAPFLGAPARHALQQRWPKPSGDCAELAPAVAALREAGVPLLAGADSPNPGTAHGVSLHDELALLVDAGLSPTEALTAATAAPAKAFGLDDRGRIAPGLRADLVLVEGDPTADIRATRHIVAVWARGRRVDRDAFRARVAAATKPAETGPVGGLVSDFEGGTGATKFGSGWSPSTDQIMGGTSQVKVSYEDGAMVLRGEAVANPQGFVWSGALFSPGAGMMQPADLSGSKEIVLRAKGKPGTYAVILFAQSLGQRPAVQTIQVGADWSEHRLPLSAFGVDGSDLTGLFVGAFIPGTFELHVDDVAFR